LTPTGGRRQSDASRRIRVFANLRLRLSPCMGKAATAARWIASDCEASGGVKAARKWTTCRVRGRTASLAGKIGSGRRSRASSGCVAPLASDEPPALGRLADLLGELGRFAGQELAELFAQLVVGDVEGSEDLGGDSVLVRAQ
jgi:hypothetical protein